MTVVQTLGVVHGLVGNMKIVMEGAVCLRGGSQILLLSTCSDGRASTDSIRQDLSMCLTRNRFPRADLGL